MLTRIIIFLVINFAALGLGGLFTGIGVSSDWYSNLNKAPWTPPGWAFGLVWTIIMICLAIYMAYLWPELENKKLFIGLFSLQWVLNILWNPVFFYYQNSSLGLIIISILTILVIFILVFYYPILSFKSALILPYAIWLIIATSLNAYIYINN